MRREILLKQHNDGHFDQEKELLESWDSKRCYGTIDLQSNGEIVLNMRLPFQSSISLWHRWMGMTARVVEFAAEVWENRMRNSMTTICIRRQHFHSQKAEGVSLKLYQIWHAYIN